VEISIDVALAAIAATCELDEPERARTKPHYSSFEEIFARETEQAREGGLRVVTPEEFAAAKREAEQLAAQQLYVEPEMQRTEFRDNAGGRDLGAGFARFKSRLAEAALFVRDFQGDGSGGRRRGSVGLDKLKEPHRTIGDFLCSLEAFSAAERCVR
jgi:hypothetical protein